MINHEKKLKTAFGMLMICLTLSVSGCESVNILKDAAGNLKDTVEEAVEDFELPTFQTSDGKAKAYVNYVFDAASSGDEDAIYDLFSDVVREEIGEEELRRQIKELIDFYQGTEILSTNTGVNTQEGVEHGVKRTDIRIFSTIETDAGDYRCALIYVARADEAPEEEGFSCIQAAEDETVDHDFRWADYNICHGVFVFE